MRADTRDGPRAIPRRDRRNSSTRPPQSAEVLPGGSLPAPADNDPEPDRPGRGQANAVTLPYDQIAPERLSIGDATGRLDGHNGVLDVALAQWAARDDSRADAAIRRAANTALDSIDAMLAELHGLRADLIGQIRRSDDLAAERADALLGHGQPPGVT